MRYHLKLRDTLRRSRERTPERCPFPVACQACNALWNFEYMTSHFRAPAPARHVQDALHSQLHSAVTKIICLPADATVQPS